MRLLRGRAPRGRRSGARRFGRVMTYAVLGFWSVVCLFPLYWVAVTTLKTPQAIIDGPVYVPFLDFIPSLDSWDYILFNATDDTWRRYGNSVLVAVSATGLTIVIGGLAAYGLARLPLNLSMRAIGTAVGAMLLGVIAIAMGVSSRLSLAASVTLVIISLVTGRRPEASSIGNEQIALSILVMRILPPVAVAVPIYFIVQGLGMVDTWSALIAVYVATNLPLAVWLFRDVVAAIPRETEEAAELDGASRLRVLRDITLPLARGGVAAVAVLIFVFCWNEYILALFLTTDHALTMPPFLAGQMAVREQLAGSDPQWGYFTVLITLMVAPLVVVAGLLHRVIAAAFVGPSSK
jgi:multiple sugar transport system permease protein